MDSVVKEISNKLGKKTENNEILIAFSDKIDRICSSGKNVIIDGNFLNLLTRMALVDSLHTYGYGVSLVDITPIFEITIIKRIMAEASREMGISINEGNVLMYVDNPMFVATQNKVMEYHISERKNTCYDQQVLMGIVPFGVKRLLY